MALIDRKQREFERREEDILDAALLLFSQPNWETVSIEKVAKEAQIGKGTIYKHVESRDELLFKLMLRFYTGLLAALPAKNMLEQPALEGFEKIFRTVLSYHAEHSEYRHIVEYCKRIDFKERAKHSWHEAFQTIDQTLSEYIDPVLEKAMNQGLIARRPLQQIHLGLIACFEGVVGMLWTDADWCSRGTEEEITEGVIDFLLAGLKGQAKSG